jgi:hypothetical protein
VAIKFWSSLCDDLHRNTLGELVGCVDLRLGNFPANHFEGLNRSAAEQAERHLAEAAGKWLKETGWIDRARKAAANLAANEAQHDQLTAEMERLADAIASALATGKDPSGLENEAEAVSRKLAALEQRQATLENLAAQPRAAAEGELRDVLTAARLRLRDRALETKQRESVVLAKAVEASYPSLHSAAATAAACDRADSIDIHVQRALAEAFSRERPAAAPSLAAAA